MNSKIAGDVEQKYSQLSSQIKNQNENFANLVKEKMNDRMQFEQEKTLLQNKIRSENEFIRELQTNINELNLKNQTVTEAKVT